jgi:DNA recombination protein RmuC
VLKDAKMREQAGVIQKEVGTLVEDIDRLDSRVESLAKHFKQANEDIDSIKISSSKIGRRIQKIEDIELGEAMTHVEVARLANDG